MWGAQCCYWPFGTSGWLLLAVLGCWLLVVAWCAAPVSVAGCPVLGIGCCSVALGVWRWPLFLAGVAVEAGWTRDACEAAGERSSIGGDAIVGPAIEEQGWAGEVVGGERYGVEVTSDKGGLAGCCCLLHDAGPCSLQHDTGCYLVLLVAHCRVHTATTYSVA